MITKRSSRIALLGLAVLVLGASGWGYSYWKSPKYALMQLASAVADGDEAVIRQRLNISAASAQVSANVIDAAVQSAMAEQSTRDASGFEALGMALGAAFADRMKPAFAAKLESMLDSAITERKLGAIGERLATAEGDQPEFTRNLGGLAGSFLGFGEVAQYQDSATVGVQVRPEALDTVLTLDVRMGRHDGVWQVVGLPNIGKHLVTLQRLQERELARVNDRIFADMAQLVEIGPLRTRLESRGWFEESLSMSALIANKSGDRITEVSASIYDVDGTLLGSGFQLGAYNIPAHGKGTLTGGLRDFNQFMTEHAALAQRPQRLLIKPNRIVRETASGPQQIERLYSWQAYLDAKSKGTLPNLE